MKTCRCLECERDIQSEDWVPNPFICEECYGPWSHSKPEPWHGGVVFHGPDWVYGAGRGWTQEKQNALEATDKARTGKFWAEFHAKRFEAFMEAFMAT